MSYIDLIDDVISGIQTSTKRKNNIKNGIEALLSNGLKDKEYSATCSTVLLKSDEFLELKGKMVLTNLWEERHSDLEDKLKRYMLV